MPERSASMQIRHSLVLSCISVQYKDLRCHTCLYDAIDTMAEARPFKGIHIM